jgi:hypothetical protein
MSARKLLSRAITSVVLGGALLLLGGVTPAHADDYTKCQDKLAVAQGRLNHDIDHHGPYSHQARSDQNRLYEAQNWCSSHHIAVGGNQNGRYQNYGYNNNQNGYNGYGNNSNGNYQGGFYNR